MGYLAAMLYAVRPDNGLFTVKDRILAFAPEKKDEIVKAFIVLASAKPVVRRPFRPPTNNTPPHAKPKPITP
jgi:hypothetical protein